jgi:deoxyribonuclease-4
MRIGAHVSSSGGLCHSVAVGRELGCETIQVFLSNPRGWAMPPDDPEGDGRFRELAAEAEQRPVFVHAPYLVNFASKSDRFRERARVLVAATMARGAEIGAAGVVVHSGSAMGAGRTVGIERIRSAVLPLLEPADGPDLLFELTAGAGDAVASRFEEMAELLDALDDHPRLRVCFDTCHAYAAGYDLSRADVVAATLDELFDVLAGRVALVHANDCAEPLGAHRDHHAPIGAGEIGMDGFSAILAHPGLADLPVVIETPGSREERAADVARLRALAGAWKTADSAPPPPGATA